MKTILMLAACILLNACATQAQPKAPEPTRYAMSCKDSLNAWMDCYERNGANCDAAGNLRPGS